MMPQDQQFQILSCIGKGGFGEVYRARKVGDGGFRKDVALKVLNTDMAKVEDVAARLKDEARILGLLNHRAIVKVDLLAQLAGRWTVVMEFVEGADLKEILSACGSLPVSAAIEICQEVASALDYAYNHEVEDPQHPERGRQPLRLLHRDIKPGNIQLTAHGDVKVLDFGIARAEFDSREAKTGSNMFLTKEYAAPERLSGTEHPGGDVFSLGAVLYELLTGSRLNLLGPAVKALMQGVRGFKVESYQTMRMEGVRYELGKIEGMTPELIELVVSTLAWKPEPRPTAREFKTELRRIRRSLPEGEELGEWAERVIGPLVRQRRGVEAGEPRGEGRSGGELAGRTVVTDGRSFKLVPGETRVDGTMPLDLDEPSSAWSIEQGREGGMLLPPGEIPGQAAGRTSRLRTEPPGPSQPPNTTVRDPGPERPAGGPVGRRGVLLGFVAVGLVLGVCAGVGGLVLRGLGDEPVAEVAEVDDPKQVHNVEGPEQPEDPKEAVDETTEGQDHIAENEDVPSEPAGSTGPSKPDATPGPTGEETPTGDKKTADPEPPLPKPPVVKVQPKAPSTEQVHVTGDATAIVLKGESGSVEVTAPGRAVPVGQYDLRARWSDGELSRSFGVVKVEAGDELSVSCDSWKSYCFWR